MRYIIVLTCLLLSTVADAICLPNGIIECLSKSGTLNQNGIIIMQFYGSSRELIPGLHKKQPMYLRSDDHKVMLDVVEVLAGEFAVSQVILKPAGSLHIGSVYTLDIDSLTASEPGFRKYDGFMDWLAWCKFLVKAPDHSAPVLIGRPLPGGKSRIPFACGPDQQVSFKLDAHDDTELFVRATVRHKRSHHTTTYMLNITNDTVSIGHHMCGGPFRFKNGGAYKVSFQLYDQSGNTSPMTKAIRFRRPTEQDYKPWPF